MILLLEGDLYDLAQEPGDQSIPPGEDTYEEADDNVNTVSGVLF